MKNSPKNSTIFLKKKGRGTYPLDFVKVWPKIFMATFPFGRLDLIEGNQNWLENKIDSIQIVYFSMQTVSF